MSEADDHLRPIAQHLLRGLAHALEDLPPAHYPGPGWEEGPGSALAPAPTHGRLGWVKRRAALADAGEMIARALRDAYEAGARAAPRQNAEQYEALLDAAYKTGVVQYHAGPDDPSARRVIWDAWITRERQRSRKWSERFPVAPEAKQS